MAGLPLALRAARYGRMALVERELVVFGSRDPRKATDLPAPAHGQATARAVEHYVVLFAALIGALRTPTFNIAVTC